MNLEYTVVSEGTHRIQDLLPKIANVLEMVNPAGYQQVFIPGCGYSPVPSDAWHDDSHEWWDSDEASTLLDSIWESVDENMPEGWEFGFNEGDGALLEIREVSIQSEVDELFDHFANFELGR